MIDVSENTDTINQLLEDIKSLEAELEKAKEKIKVLESALRFDKTGLAGALASVVSEVNARRWILEGRGPYTYDDKAYQREAKLAFDSIEEIASKALNRSGLLVVAARYAISASRKDD